MREHTITRRQTGVDWPLIRRVADQWRRVADCFLGDFYPLTDYQLNEELWLAWQFDLPERGRGMVQVFRRAASSYESARFRLRGLDPNARYRMINFDAPNPNQEFTGRELLETGLLVSLAGRPAAAIIAYQRAD